jgi:hypothetical protein
MHGSRTDGRTYTLLETVGHIVETEEIGILHLPPPPHTHTHTKTGEFGKIKVSKKKTMKLPFWSF